MRVAIVHYWLVGMRGGEKVLEALCALFPQADIFTHVYAPEAVSPAINAHRVVTSFISRLPAPRRMYKAYLPLMPLALEQLDLRGYDLVISSEAGPAKGVIVDPSALHICYCHSPMRYIWNMYQEHLETAGVVRRAAMPLLCHYLRWWDVTTQARVHHFVANAYCVADRIKTYYGRPAVVIHPPVAIGSFAPVPQDELEDFYLMVGELVPYKRADLAVSAFNNLGRPLVVIGGGEALPALKKVAKGNIRFLGPQPFVSLQWHYARCKALVFPGEEDFGIVPVEAMASGRPVIAYGRGGACETIVDGKTGIFFPEQTVESLMMAIQRLEAMRFDQATIAAMARRFDGERFKASFRDFAEQRLKMHRQRTSESPTVEADNAA